jgi:hypothetical protein
MQPTAEQVKWNKNLHICSTGVGIVSAIGLVCSVIMLMQGPPMLAHGPPRPRNHHDKWAKDQADFDWEQKKEPRWMDQPEWAGFEERPPMGRDDVDIKRRKLHGDRHNGKPPRDENSDSESESDSEEEDLVWGP